MKDKLFFLIAFIEGGCVLGTELISAKMIAPFFGSSLYVWSVVLALTLAGLTCGYFLGGILSGKGQSVGFLTFSLAAAGVLLLIMPWWSQLIMSSFLQLPLIAAIFLSALLFFFPILVLLGTASPLIIGIVSKDASDSGKISGIVYGISTTGGILFTFLVGLYSIPYLGLRLSSILCGSLLLFAAALGLTWHTKNRMPVLLCLASISVFLVNYPNSDDKYQGDKIQLMQQQSGIQGQLMLAEDRNLNNRSLLIDNISQTNMDLATRRSRWPYVYRLATFCSTKPKGSKVLLAGLGGGMVAKELLRLGFIVDVVDIDKRMMQIAEEYFLHPDEAMKIRFFEDDIRHHLRSTKEQYDILIYDISLSEGQPSHLYTKEAFENVHSVLFDDGFFLIHFPDFYEDPSQVLSSLGKTLSAGNFFPNLINTNPRQGQLCELMLYASKSSDIVFNFNRLPVIPTGVDFDQSDQVFLAYSYEGGQIMYDDKPILDVLRTKTVQLFRENSIKSVLQPLWDGGVQFY